MFRKIMLGVVGFLVLGASTAVFADTGAPFKDKNGDTVQNHTSDDGMTREETRWRKDGRYVSKTTYKWDGCRWIEKEFHFWKKDADGEWRKDSADKLQPPSSDTPNGGKAPTPNVDSGAASTATSAPSYHPKTGSTLRVKPLNRQPEPIPGLKPAAPDRGSRTIPHDPRMRNSVAKPRTLRIP
jgi:hypothetical protein